MQVKNKTPAEIQITAEQLLREAKERDLEIVPPVRICCVHSDILVAITYIHLLLASEAKDLGSR